MPLKVHTLALHEIDALATGGSLAAAGTPWKGNIARDAQAVPAVVICTLVLFTGACPAWFQVIDHRLPAVVA